MNKERLTPEELYYLGEYQEIDTIYGIPKKEHDISTKRSLIEKGILDTNGRVNQVTVSYVELLKKYAKAKEYFRIHQYLFGVHEDGVCVVIKKHYHQEEFQYQLLIGDVIVLLQTAMSHPMIQKAAMKYAHQKEEEKEIQRSILLIEHFDKDFKWIEELSIGMKADRYYEVTDELEFGKEIEEVDSFVWLVKRLPQLQDCIEELSIGVKENERNYH